MTTAIAVTKEMIEAVAWSASPQEGMPWGMILDDKAIENILSIGLANSAALTPHGEEAAGPAPVSHLVGAEPAAWGHYAADRKTLLNVFYAEPESYTAYPGEVIVPLRPDFSGVASPSPQSNLVGDDFLHRLVENAFSWGKQDCNYLNPKHMDKFIGYSDYHVETWS